MYIYKYKRVTRSAYSTQYVPMFPESIAEILMKLYNWTMHTISYIFRKSDENSCNNPWIMLVPISYECSGCIYRTDVGG